MTTLLILHILLGLAFLSSSFGRLLRSRLLERMLLPTGIATIISGGGLVFLGSSLTQACVRFGAVAVVALLIQGTSVAIEAKRYN